MGKQTSVIDIEGKKFKIELFEQSFRVDSDFNLTKVTYIKSVEDIKEMVDNLVRQGMALKSEQIRNVLGLNSYKI